jgi:hypothetical protein
LANAVTWAVELHVDERQIAFGGHNPDCSPLPDHYRLMLKRRKTMEKAERSPTERREPPAAEQRKQPDHTERITSQVLAKIDKPPRFDRVEVCRHHNGKYRVNIWQQFQPDDTVAVMPSSRIVLSYYLTVSGTGEIIKSDPPLSK